MGKTQLYDNDRAETEANEVAYRFVNSRDVIGDMGRAYGTSFSNIRMHDDAASHSKVRAAGKDAIASGKDIYFGEGILNDHSEMGNMIVGHELAHTMQQAGGFGMSETVSMGAEQGGLWSTIKGWFSKNKGKDKGKDKDKEIKWDVMKDEESKDYMAANRFMSRDSWSSHLKPIVTAASNKALGNDPENYKVADALVDLGHRESSKESGKQDFSTRRYANRGLDDRLKSFFQSKLAGKTEEDGRQMMSGAVRYGKKGQKISAGTEALTQEMLDVMDQQMHTDDVLEYFSSFYDQLEDADVFTKAGEDPMNYMYATYMTGSGINAATQRNAVQNEMGLDMFSSPDLAKALTQSTNNMMLGTSLYRMSPEEMAGVSQYERDHLSKYMERRANLVTAINALRARKGKGAMLEHGAGESARYWK